MAGDLPSATCEHMNARSQEARRTRRQRICRALQAAQSPGDTGKDDSLFGMLVIMYLFLGGASAGAFFVMSLWSLVFHRRDDVHDHRMRLAFKALLGRCYALCFALLAVAALCLVWDLGSPERALLLFTKAHPTVLTLGAFSLAAQLLIGLTLATANLFALPRLGGRAKQVLEVLCCACSCVVMAYTGLLLAGSAIPFWSTWTLVVLFFFSALSSGVSTVLLLDYFTQGQTLLLRSVKPLQRAHVACLLLEAAALALFLGAAFSNPQAQPSVALLLEPDMLANGAVGVLGMGLAVPLVLETTSLARKESRSIPVSDVVCLIGGFLLRYCIVACGAHWAGPVFL